jgi:hypothetical protein
MAVTDLVIAANGGVPGNALKPHNCHEAVLGWVLSAKYAPLRVIDPVSHGVAKAWLTLRSLAERYGQTSPKQLTGPWMAQHLYRRGYTRVAPPLGRGGTPSPQFARSTFSIGDVLFMGNPAAPHHSMVVVEINGEQALARGFNNAGAFGGPFMDWDSILRDVTDSARWDVQGRFMANNGPSELYAISYEALCLNIPDNLNF